MPMRARVAGTKLPICASRAISAFWRRKVDLPAMLGPVSKRLAMDDGGIQRRRHQPVAVLRGHLDEIAEHVVVADLQALHAGVVSVARLHRGHHEARGVGPPTAAVLANSAWGLLGFGMAIAVMHVAVVQFGVAVGLSLALGTCVTSNLTLWGIGRRAMHKVHNKRRETTDTM